MIKIKNSIVGKLWITILLLVSFVLFLFTVLMLEFLNDYYNDQSKNSLEQTANIVEKIVEKNESNSYNLIEDVLAEDMNAFIVKDNKDILYSYQTGKNKEDITKTILKNKAFKNIYSSDKQSMKNMILPSQVEKDKMESYVVLAQPVKIDENISGAIFIYQNPSTKHSASQQTTRIVFFAAVIAFVLTTFFAFFLSSRITKPLREMREHAFEIAKGKFDNQLPTLQGDEIGQLAVAFNQMGRQLKHHLEVINQEKEQLSNILTSMTDGVITFNRDRTILLSNPPADRLLQKWFYQKQKESENPLPDAINAMLIHVLEFEDRLDEDIEIDGSFYRITISPLKSSGQIIRGAIAVIRDMTEQRQLDKLRSDFIANVSHELRTPIAMLQGYSEAIVDDVVVSDEEKNEMIRIIYDESKRMGRLVTDLLDLARMESGHTTLYTENLPIIPVIERITQKFGQAAKEKHVQLNFTPNVPEDLMIDLDEDRIEQVLTNLIDNALRHTPQDGSVTVSIEQEMSYVKISVTDTGEGIPKEDLPFVFERFYKADKARTRSKGGTGLGLAIAKNIVEGHKGHIRVDSEVGVGTSFTFYLPIS